MSLNALWVLAFWLGGIGMAVSILGVAIVFYLIRRR